MLQFSSKAQNFEPKFFTGGPTWSYLPLFYDIVAYEKPALIVILGLGDGQAHLAVCQALAEQNSESRCVVIRRSDTNELAENDAAFAQTAKVAQEFFPITSRLLAGDSTLLAKEFGDNSIDVLMIDDVDSGGTIRAELEAWSRKLADDALFLLHGIDLERHDPPRRVWQEWPGHKAEFHHGIGLGIAFRQALPAGSAFRNAVRDDAASLDEKYRILAELMRDRALAKQTEHRARILDLRQIWFDTILQDRVKAQNVMDHQARVIADHAKAQEILEERFAILQKEAADAQVVIQHQVRSLQRTEKDLEHARRQSGERNRLLAAAKSACRKKGRCFEIARDGKPRRSVPQRIARELARIPRNVRRVISPGVNRQATPGRIQIEPPSAEDRYAQWIAAHEPGPEELRAQRVTSSSWKRRPKISFLIPVFDPSSKFLDELFGSICAQSYGHWEACVVDAGPDKPDTVELLRRWSGTDARIQIERLEKNLGIAENTNQALRMATGDFVALVDHDDLLAPFALYEIASAILCEPTADIFYSDEDRLSESGARVRPFFKPEWSPELLFSFMYIGHLTSYRREFVRSLGGFRKDFDLSQDYDFALRATECARAIVHLPHVLYHWREHRQSGASGGKPHARKSNIAALADAVKRRELDAEVIEYPTANRVRMFLRSSPRVSVIIPTDSPARAENCARLLPQATDYANAEFVIVTKSALIDQLRASPISERVRFVPFDLPFNFSAKCNTGARVANGERLIFLNDDVEAGQSDWIENVIEPLENRGVGAVAPKMLYETGRIQHAGLVTGVRGLIGTAMHQWPGDSVDYANFAQSMRNVSALSAACLAARREVFFEVGGFDETNTPIAHSDVDLCFKIRAAGLRCVYTPFATMTHRGHESIGAEEPARDARDKSSIFLLRRWANYTSHDPYYPDNMRDWLYADSPTPFRIFGPKNSGGDNSGRDLLFVTHDLTLSGAPIIVAHLAKWCREQGLFVVVVSPVDGPVRRMLGTAGIPVLIDPLVATGFESFVKFGQQSIKRSHTSFGRFARDFDCMIASTIFGAALVADARAESVPNIWWIHEGKAVENSLKKYPIVAATVEQADLILTPDDRTRRILQRFTSGPVESLPCGIPDAGADMQGGGTKGTSHAMRFLLLGTIEGRKGQQILLRALGKLPPEILERCHFQIVGRVHDTTVAAEIRKAAARSAHLSFIESVEHGEALALIREADVMVCTSLDETGPLTVIEAMSLGKPILSTRVGAVGEKLVPEEDALVVSPGDSSALACAIERLVLNPVLLGTLAANSRRAYERYFTLEQFGKEFLKMVEEVVAGRQRKKNHRVGRNAVAVG